MKEKIKLNANALKVIAIIAMTIDHFTDIFYPGFPSEPAPIALHFIGRLTARLLCGFSSAKAIIIQKMQRNIYKDLVFINYVFLGGNFS